MKEADGPKSFPRWLDKAKALDLTAIHAPTSSTPGKKPSFKLLSSFLTSSTEVALAMAFLTLSASSFVINLPALAAERGSSVVTAVAVLCADTVVDNVVASELSRPSGVVKSPFAYSRS